MFRFLMVITAALVVCGTLKAQPPQDMLAGRVSALESRVAALEAKLGVQSTQTQPTAYQSQPVTYYYAQPMQGYGMMFGDGGSSVCGPGGCGQATTGRVGLFRRR